MLKLELLNQTNSVDTSEKYRVVTSSDIITKMNELGYQLTSTNAVKPRKQDRNGYQKHLMRFASNDIVIGSEERPEIIVVNSYDGTSGINIYLGFYRFACANGLIVGSGVDGASVRHVGEPLKRIESEVERLVASVPTVYRDVQRYKDRKLTDFEVAQLVNKSFKFVVGENRQPLSSFNPIRIEDSNKTAWAVFNTVQEVSLKFGVRYFDHETNKTNKTRQVRSVKRIVDINKHLWSLMNEIAS